MTTALALSYWNLNNPRTGGIRRVNHLLDTVGPNTILCQPGDPHPRFQTVSLGRNFGKRKLFINWGIFNFLWPRNAKLVRELVEKEKPAVIVLTSTWTYFPLRQYPDIPMVLDAHDINAIAIGERYGPKHPFTRLVRYWEAKVVQRANHVFACSELDREQFSHLYGVSTDKISVAPNGISVSDGPDTTEAMPLPPEHEKKLKGATVLLFVGGMGYQPNREAASLLNTAIMPELEKKAPGKYRLVVCGGNPPGPVHSSVIAAGWVEDRVFQGCLRRSNICLAPVETGSGTRNKILEYMAARKPVISTAKGAEGLLCTDGKDIVIADKDRFCDAIVKLANDSKKARDLADAGYQLVRDNYGWETSVKPVWRQALKRWLTSDENV